MAFEAPPVDEISARIRADFRREMPGTEPGIWPNNLYVITKVFAQIASAYYQRQEWLIKQRFAHLADSEGLDEHGADVGVARLPATYAAGDIKVTATIGTVIAAGTRFRRSDGAIYTTDALVTTTLADTNIPSHAEEAGRGGNVVADVVLTMETPLAAITAHVVGAGGIKGGSDIENDASMRSRILDRKRNPPMGGSLSDYVRWTREYPGVTKVWVLRATPTPGEVTVIFMMDYTYADGIPLAGDVTAVEAILDANAPAAAGLVVQAPVAQPINVTITGLSPNTQPVKDEITRELAAMIRRRAVPGSFEEPFTFSRSWLSEAIAMSTGEDKHSLTLPAADILFQAAAPGDPPRIATLGSLTWL